MKSIWKRISLLMAVVLLLTGCGKGNEKTVDEGNTEKAEYVYLPEYHSLNEYGEWISGLSKAEDSIYFLSNDWNEETEETTNKIFQYDVAAKSASELPFKMESKDRYLQNFWVHDDGTVSAIVNGYEIINEETHEGKSLYFLSKYDATGQLISEQDITQAVMGESEWAYMQNPQLDSQGNLYYYDGEQSIKGISVDGQPIMEVKLDSYASGIALTQDDRLFYACYGNEGNMTIKEVNIKTGQTIGALENLPKDSGNFDIFAGTKENTLYIKVSSDVYEYSLETNEAVKLFNWLDIDINSDNVSTILQMDDNTFCTLMSEWSEESQDNQLVFITKTKNEGVAEKKVLTLAVSWEDSMVKEAVIKFNRNSSTHKIEIKTYEPTEESISSDLLKADIAAGNVPDIIDIGVMDYENLIRTGVLTDLTPFMENDANIKKEKLMQSALTPFVKDEKLYALPTSFSLSTLIGKTSILGDKSSWNVAEYKEFLATLPEGTQVLSYASKSNVFDMMMYSTMGQFIDWESGNCSFDSEEFISIMEFANTFPEETDYDNDVSLPESVQTNKTALLDIYISSVEEYQMYSLMFEEPITCIGFPTESGNGARIELGSNIFAITEECADKEVAWSFLREFYTLDSQQSGHFWGFPILKDALDKQFEQAMEKEYRTLEDGTKEEVEKTTWGYDDWEAKIYAATPEQVEAVKALMEGADTTLTGNLETMAILREEADAYFKGQKSAEEVADIIQSRMKIYVSENQ